MQDMNYVPSKVMLKWPFDIARMRNYFVSAKLSSKWVKARLFGFNSRLPRHDNLFPIEPQFFSAKTSWVSLDLLEYLRRVYFAITQFVLPFHAKVQNTEILIHQNAIFDSSTVLDDYSSTTFDFYSSSTIDDYSLTKNLLNNIYLFLG